jgi:hypothetical protein
MRSFPLAPRFPTYLEHPPRSNRSSALEEYLLRFWLKPSFVAANRYNNIGFPERLVLQFLWPVMKLITGHQELERQPPIKNMLLA